MFHYASFQKLLSGKRLRSFVPELLFILNDCIRHDHDCLGGLTVRASSSCTRAKSHKIHICLSDTAAWR